MSKIVVSRKSSESINALANSISTRSFQWQNSYFTDNNSQLDQVDQFIIYLICNIDELRLNLLLTLLLINNKTNFYHIKSMKFKVHFCAIY